MCTLVGLILVDNRELHHQNVSDATLLPSPCLQSRPESTPSHWYTSRTTRKAWLARFSMVRRFRQRCCLMQIAFSMPQATSM